MPIRTFQCQSCKKQFRSKQEQPRHCEMPADNVLVAPQTKFMEVTHADKGISRMVNQDKMLKSRARSHSRDVEMNDLIENNPREEAIKNGWIREDGQTRKAIDDI